MWPMMNPWCLEQATKHHRREMLAQACRTQSERPPRLRKRLAARRRRAL
jgi:hypothetical protein